MYGSPSVVGYCYWLRQVPNRASYFYTTWTHVWLTKKGRTNILKDTSRSGRSSPLSSTSGRLTSTSNNCRTIRSGTTMPRRATALMSPGDRPQTPPLSFDLSTVFLFTTNKITALVLSPFTSSEDCDVYKARTWSVDLTTFVTCFNCCSKITGILLMLKTTAVGQ